MLAACGGGSGSVPPLSVTPTPASTATPTPPGGSAAVTFKIDLPGSGSSAARRVAVATSRRPQFIDTVNGTQLAVTISSVNATDVNRTTSYAIGGGGPVTCTTGCTLTTTLPVGLDLVQVTLEDASNRPLAQNEVTMNVVQVAGGAPNQIPVTLNGVVASLAAPTCAASTFQSDGQHLALTATAKDFDSATIVGPGAYGALAPTDAAAVLNPLTISSTNQNATFSVNGNAATNPATINNPGDTITLIYRGPAPTGSTTVPVTLAATVPTALPGSVAIAPVTGTCTLAQNGTFSADPKTVFSNVSDTALWTVQAGFLTANPFNALCNGFGGGQTLCYYTISSGSFGPISTTSSGSYSFTYTGYALLNYASVAYGSFAIQSIQLTFTDRSNTANTFFASIAPSSTQFANVATTIPGTITTQLSAPAAPALATVAGTSTAGTDDVVITYVNPQGETGISAQTALAHTAAQQIRVTSPAASGNATGYNVYAGHVNGGPYFKQNVAPVAIGSTFTNPGTLLAVTPTPSTNTTAGILTFAISGGTGVFAGLSGSFTTPFNINPNGTAATTQSIMTSTTDSGTLQGI